MARQVEFHFLFDCDVHEAADWYQQRSAGLGDTFVEDVWRCIDDVIADPERYGTLPSGCRHKRLSKFPYVLLYDLTDEDLLLLAVVHTARSPKKWNERLPDR